ncbi:helix-turn-helix domain-containing protein, partial [Streptomyces drozdowiczii]|uniref:helix-turn-helix domain-containing protein n=1 Tax=Streptomyces drozdowiczii TaxID=202862 RepID=UPI00403D12E8
MTTSRSAATARQPVVSLRRRGSVLERAILEAALEALSTVGWNGLTMEGVAAGAQTGKAAIYRRWSSKEELVAEGGGGGREE